jgi:hypothetical protein
MKMCGHTNRSGLPLLLAISLMGCPSTGADDDDDVSDDDVSDDDVSDDDIGDDDTDGRAPLEACMEDSAIPFDCATVGDVQWAAAGEEVPCLAVMGGGNVAKFTFWLGQVVDESPMIEGLRLEQEQGWNPSLDDRLEFTPPAPVHLTPQSPLPTDLAWSAAVWPEAFAGALSFTEGHADEAVVTLDDPLPLGQLMNGAVVTGTFTLTGGSWTVLDGDGNEQVLDDPTAQGFGCFNVPSELYALDVD